MPPRLNKRQQREQEELLALGSHIVSPGASDDLAEDDVPLPVRSEAKKAQTGFSAVSKAKAS